MKTFARIASVALSLSALALVASLPSACSDDGGTTGKRVAFDVRVTGSPEAKAPFTNAQGWTVTLSKALVATGAMYFYDGETLLSERAPSPARRWWRALAVREAFAHPGHYVPGNAKGEILAPSSADLLKENALGAGQGISGLVRSATFSYQAPAQGPFAAELGGSVAVLEGTATKGAEARAFRIEVGAADVAATNGKTEIVGCPFLTADVQGDGTVTATVKVEAWLDQVDFTGVPVGAAPALLAEGTLPRNQIVRGMKAALPYVFSYAAR